MHFLPFVLKNLIRRPSRSALTIGGVGVAVGAVVALLGNTHGFEQSFTDLYKVRGVDMLVVQAGKVDRSTSYLDEDIGEQLEALPDVKFVNPGLVDFADFQDSKVLGVPIQGWRSDGNQMELASLRFLSGRPFNAEDKGKVMIGMIQAKNLEKSIGDPIELYGVPFEVVGIYESFNLLENSSIIVPIRELQELLGQENKVSGFQLVLHDAADPEAVSRVRTQIDELNVGASAMATEDFVKSTTQVRLAHAMTWITSAIALVIGIFGILNTMIMSVMERTREIGILRAIGWRRSRIMRMILSESLLLSVAGAVVGTIGALIVVRMLSMVPITNGFVSGNIAPVVMFKGFLIALAVGLVGGSYPAFRSAQLLPTEALRHE